MPHTPRAQKHIQMDPRTACCPYLLLKSLVCTKTIKCNTTFSSERPGGALNTLYSTYTPVANYQSFQSWTALQSYKQALLMYKETAESQVVRTVTRVAQKVMLHISFLPQK